MREAVIVSAVRTAVGKAPNGSAALHAAGRAWPRSSSPRRLRRAPGFDPAEVEDVILGCAMPEAEQGLNVARIASLRAGRAGDGVGGHGQPLLLVRAAGDRVRRRTDHGRLRQRHRRRRDRVDEPGADGRPQAVAQPGAGRQLSGRLPDAPAGRREPRARGARSRARSRTRSRCAATSARSRRSTAAGSPTRSSRMPVANGSGRTRSVATRRGAAARHVARCARRSCSPAFHVKGTVTAGNSSQTSDGAAAVS